MQKYKHIQINNFIFNIKKLLLHLCCCAVLFLMCSRFVYSNGTDNNPVAPGQANCPTICGDCSAGANSTLYASGGDNIFTSTNLLSLTVLIQGFWNGSVMVRDTIRCDIRICFFPLQYSSFREGFR